jgi:hypothetical protein
MKKERVTEIIYKNSHDTGEGLVIDFKNIHKVIDLLSESPQPSAPSVSAEEIGSIISDIEEVIESAPLDFVGTADYDTSNEEREWYNRKDNAIKRLKSMQEYAQSQQGKGGQYEDDEPERDNNSLYTYYQLELININEDWQITICESLDEVHSVLQYLDIYLDDSIELEDGQQRKVVITGIPMTPASFNNWVQEYYPERITPPNQ